MNLKEFLYRIKKYIKYPYKAVIDFCHYKNFKYARLITDSFYLRCLSKDRLSKELNLKKPATFNDKVNWLKLHDRNPAYEIMADKYKAKGYVAKIIGDKYIIPTVGVWDRVEDIKYEDLPEKFVLKCTHDSASIVLCSDKKNFDFDAAMEKLNFHLKSNYFWVGREWVYKNTERKIICEEFMENYDGSEPIEYKVYCFNGKIKFTRVISERFGDRGATFDNYDYDWNYINMYQDEHPNMRGDIYPKPKFLDEIYRASELLSKDIPFVRIDFNVWNDKVYFGEITFYPSAGFAEFKPEEWSYKLGDWIDISKIRKQLK